MPKVQYTGSADKRRILKRHFEAVGVTDQDMVIFEPGNKFTAEVSEAAANHLTTRDSFKLVEASSGAPGSSSESGTVAGKSKKGSSGGSP